MAGDNVKNTTQFGSLCKGLTDKQALFLRFFLDAENVETFMKTAPSARAAGYEAFYGYELKKRLAPRIKEFLEDCGLSDAGLRHKLIGMLETKNTKLVTLKGQVEEWELPEGVRLVTHATQTRPTQNGDHVEHSTIVAIQQEASDLQLRALDMAFKLENMYAPEKHEHSGPGGGPIELTDTERAARTAAILDAARARRAGQDADGGDV